MSREVFATQFGVASVIRALHGALCRKGRRSGALTWNSALNAAVDAHGCFLPYMPVGIAQGHLLPADLCF